MRTDDRRCGYERTCRFPPVQRIFVLGALFATINPYGLAFVVLDKTMSLSENDRAQATPPGTLRYQTVEWEKEII